MFQSINRYFKRVANSDHVSEWKSKRLSEESIKTPSAPNNFLNPKLSHYSKEMGEIFSGGCLKQEKITYTLGKIANIYIVYEISKNCNISSYPTLENCVFDTVTLTKNVDIDKCKYSGYVLGLDRHGFFHTLVVELVKRNNLWSRYEFIFILILDKDPTQGSEHTLNAEKTY